MTEDELQKYVVQWLDASLPMGSVYHHSPNEGIRNISYKMKLKALGTKWGWPDLELFVPDAGWQNIEAKGAIMLELKRPKGGRVSDTQKDIHERLRDAGVYVAVCKRIGQIEAYLNPLLKLRKNTQAELIRKICEAAGG